MDRQESGIEELMSETHLRPTLLFVRLIAKSSDMDKDDYFICFCETKYIISQA